MPNPACKDRNDKWDLEGIIRRAGYYPSFHWPQEILEFVKEARKEIVKLGFSEEVHYIRIRRRFIRGRCRLGETLSQRVAVALGLRLSVLPPLPVRITGCRYRIC